jgi:hypothetical protein
LLWFLIFSERAGRGSAIVLGHFILINK